MCRHLGYLILALAMTSGLASGQQRPQAPTRTAPSAPQNRHEPLTDRDVIRMVESGKPEASIVAIIRSSRTNFDFSPQACRFLAEAHVSRAILNAMGDGSRPPCASTSESSKPKTPAAVEQCVAACTAQCQKIAGNSARLSMCSKECVQRCQQNGAPGSGNNSRSTLLKPASPAIQSSSGAANSTGMLATSSSAEGQRALGGAGALPGNRNAGLLGDGSAHAPATVTTPASGGRRVALKPVKLTSPKALKKVTNPRSTQENASIIAVLQKQRQMAEQEASALKLQIRSAPSAGAATVSAQKVAPSTGIRANAGASQVGPERTQDASGPSGFQIVNKQYAEPPSIACAKDATPRILSAPSVFTPEAKYNLFTISGCGFGPTAAANTAYIFGGNGFRENLAIDFWSDHGITAHLDPALAGVLDQNNITLVVAPSGRQALQKSGFKFYAARGMPAPGGNDQEVPLAYNSIPHSNVAIFNANNFIAGFDRLPSNATSNFPSFSFQGTPVAGWVFRYAYEHDDRIATFRSADCFINDTGFNGDPCLQFKAIGFRYTVSPGAWQLKSDTWDLSKLAPGFQISSYQLYVSTLDPASLCGSWDDLGKADAYLDGDWDFNLTAQNQIVVKWPVYRCQNQEFGTRNNMMIQSAYGLAVSVMGPRCIDPWTGQKDQSCMNKIKQIL